MSRTSALLVVALCCAAHIATARPSDAPIKFDLGKTNVTRSLAEVGAKGMERIGRLVDALRLARGDFVNKATRAKNIIVKTAEDLTSEAQNSVATAVATKRQAVSDFQREGERFQKGALGNLLPPVSRETARLEVESGQSIFERRNPVSHMLQNFLKPSAPLVDRIKEEEKYGNTGDRFINVGRALVNGFEGLSNFLNSIVDFPIDAAKKTSRGVTEALNQFGSKLVGLQ